MSKILLIGEPLIILSANEYSNLENSKTFSKRVAGAELNVSIGLTRLGHDVEYITKLPNDMFGKNILSYLKSENIGIKYSKIVEGSSVGLQFKNRVKVGDPDILYYRKNSAATTLSVSDIENVDVEEFDLIHITGIPLGISQSFREALYFLLERAKKHNKIVSFDPNIRVSMWDDLELMKKTMNEFAIHSDYFMPGINECEMLIDKTNLDEIVKTYLDLGVKNLIIKDGAKGSYYINNETKVFKEGFKVKEVVDTVGAGDGFAVGIISSILEGLSPEKMLERANAIGAIQVSNISDNEGLPTKKELIEYINKK